MILPAMSVTGDADPIRQPEGDRSRIPTLRERRTYGEGRPWEAPERFTAEMALRDLPVCTGDVRQTERVVARYVVARIAAWDPLAALDPEADVACALEYVGVLPDGAERRALEGVLRGTVEGQPWLLATSLRAAAEPARAAGHGGGAFLLYRQAFTVARRATLRAEAARCARGIEALAREAGASAPARAWAARARRLERATPDTRAIMEAMAEGYTREQRAALERALREGEVPHCPACGERVMESRVTPRADVAYVRRRIWLLCSGCRRSASLDVSAGGRP